MSEGKRLTIVLGVTALDESKSTGEFCKYGFEYNDAPPAVLQAVHEVINDNPDVIPKIMEAAQPITRALIDLGYQVAAAKGENVEELERIRKHFDKGDKPGCGRPEDPGHPGRGGR